MTYREGNNLYTIRGKSAMELFFYGYIMLLTFAKAWGLDSGDKAYKIIACIASALILIYIIYLGYLQIHQYCVLKKQNNIAIGGRKIYSFRDMAICMVVLIVAGIVTYESRKLAILMFALAFVCAKGIDIEKIVKSMGTLWIAVFCIRVFGTMAGAFENTVLVHERLLIGERARYGMGYLHPNLFQASLCIAILYYGYIDKKITWWKIGVMQVIVIWGYLCSYSNSGFIICELAMIGIGLNAVKGKRLIGFWSKACIVPIFVSVIMVIFRKEGIVLYIFTDLLSGRNKWAQRYLDAYPVTLFGQVMDGRVPAMLDNAYIFVLLRCGLVVTILLFIGYIMTIRYYKEKEDSYKIFVCLIFLLYGIAEQMVVNCFMNFSLLFLCEVFWMDEGKELLDQERPIKILNRNVRE